MASDLTALASATHSVRPQTAHDALLGQVFNGRYRVEALLARGGMGRVYRAVQLALGRRVALKVLDPACAGAAAADFQQRFCLEAGVAARLSHPHTVTVFDYGRSDAGVYYIAMELLEGESLRARLERVGSLPPAQALRVAGAVAAALAEAHALGVVHRDLKPHNIFLQVQGSDPDYVKVLDFGLVKQIDGAGHTQPGRFLGSPVYMAPEQVRGAPLDGRCDVYALGVLLLEMLTGAPPFVRDNAVQTMMAHVHDALPPLRVAPALQPILRRALAKDPAERFASIGDMQAALQAALAGAPAVAEPALLRGGNPAPSGPSVAAPSLAGGPAPSGRSVAVPSLAGGPAPSGPSMAAPSLAGSPAPSGPPVAESPRAGTITGELPRRRGAALPPLAEGATAWSIALPAVMAAPERGPWASCAAVQEATQYMPRAARAVVALPATVAPVAPPRCRRGVAGAWLAAALLLLLALPQARLWLGHARRVAATPAPRQGFLLELVSQPPGARVLLDGAPLCVATPCLLRWHGDAARPGRLLQLRFLHPDHDEFVASRVVAGRSLRVYAPLAGSP